MCLAHLEEESAKKDKEVESKDPDSIDGVMEEFIVYLVRAVKDTQMEDKCCYHYSSLEHFIHDCPLVKASGAKMHLNCKEGMVLKKGAWSPQTKVTMPKTPRRRSPQHRMIQTPFLNPDPYQHWYGVKNVDKVKTNGESCMALLDKGMQINTITSSYVKSCSLEMGLITNLISRRVACIGLGNAYTQSLGYIIVKVQVEGVQDYNEDHIALVVIDLLNFS